MPAFKNFSMFEGIDGSGKTTLARVFAEILASRGNKTIFDVPQTSKLNGELPMPWTPGHEIIFSAEPTQVWVGAGIRKELIRKGADYPPDLVAEAYAMDRHILYRRFLLPMLERGATIVSDRGLPTSICYQPIMKGGVTLDKVMAYPGNSLALENPPGHLIIVRCSAKTAIARLGARSGKDDDAIFEKEEFLTKAAERYESDWFRKIWEDRGTKVHYLDAEQPLEAVTADATKLTNELYPA